jgi:hypothetical protein
VVVEAVEGDDGSDVNETGDVEEKLKRSGRRGEASSARDQQMCDEVQ